MKTTLKVFSIIGIVLGALTILASISEPTLEDAMYCLAGGGMFIAWGVISLKYIKEVSMLPKKEENNATGQTER